MTQTKCFQLRAFYCQTRSFQHTFVQMNQLAFVLAFYLFYMIDLLCQRNDRTAQRQYHQCCADIKNGVDRTDLCLRNDIRPHRRVNQCEVDNCQNAEYNRTGNVKHQMHITYAFRCFCRTDTTQNGRYTSTDVLTHDNIYCRVEGNQPRCRQGQQDTLRSRGTLDNGRYKSTSENTQQRIAAQCYKHRFESFGILQRCNCRGHTLNTNKQNTKTNDNGRNLFSFGAFAAHHQDHTNHHGQRRNGGRTEHFCPLRTGYQPAGHRCTDIRAHDDTHGLRQIHQSRVYKTNNHNGSC